MKLTGSKNQGFLDFEVPKKVTNFLKNLALGHSKSRSKYKTAFENGRTDAGFKTPYRKVKTSKKVKKNS